VENLVSKYAGDTAKHTRQNSYLFQTSKEQKEIFENKANFMLDSKLQLFADRMTLK
jgi:hypothetical protein